LLQNPRVKNRGISADTTYGVLSRLDDIAKEKPAKIFLMIGVNDLWQGASLPDITANLAKTLTELRQRTPDTAIFLQSVLPINTIKFTASTNLTSNSQITALNKELKQLAGSHNATYIDLYAVMVSADNQLPGDLTTDGIHLNGKGYQRWKSAIRHYVE
jgi:Lysophospholipase L1 and related esterases